MLTSCNSSSRVTDTELNIMSMGCDSQSKIEQHICWITRIISRILSSSFRTSMQNSENHSISSPTSLLLNLSFVRISSIPDYSNLTLIAKAPITLTTLSNGMHYSLISSILTNGLFSFEPNRSISSQFDIIFKSLASIGFKPRQPCSQFGLMSGLAEHHINLCETFEFAIFEKSLSIEKLLEDIRKVPRSFYVLHEGFYPTKIEEAIALWLSKFPCINDLPEIKYSDFEKFQQEVSNGAYVSAVLSRIYPQRISKKSILSTEAPNNGFDSNLNVSFNFDTSTQNANWEKSKQILTELGAFVPSNFTLSYNLFMCFVSDLYYATRSGVKKFVRLERSPSAITSSRRPQTAAAAGKISEKSEKFAKTEKLNVFGQISTEKVECVKPIPSRPHTGPNVFRPSRKKAPQNSVAGAGSRHKHLDLQIHHPPCQKRPINTAIPQKRSSLLPSNPRSQADDEADLLQLFTYMKRGERKDKFVDVADPLAMVRPLAALLQAANPAKQTFSNFWALVQSDPQSVCHYRNCFAFLNALGGNNNEFAASRRVVYFARKMLESYEPQPQMEGLADNRQIPSKRAIGTSYVTRRAILARKAQLAQNKSAGAGIGVGAEFKALVRPSQSEVTLHSNA